MKTLLINLILFLFLNFSHAQSITISIEKYHYQIDHEHNIILVLLDNIENYQNLEGVKEIELSLYGSRYQIENSPSKLDYENTFEASKEEISYKLYFTQIPIIAIRSNSKIVDEPKVLANLVYVDKDTTILSKIGIEIRGGASQSHPKKTYDIELWEDEYGQATKKVSFQGLRTDDDWILDGLYNEPLRIRSHIAHNLWLEMHQPYYLDEAPAAKSGAEVRFAEVFLNGQYNGIYNLSEQVDRKQLQLVDSDETITGELYKGESWGGSVTFDELHNYDNNSSRWGGYEYRFPQNSDYRWEYVYNFTKFVINSPENDFKDRVWNKFHIGNNIDYFIFLNLTRATDNRGKNIYLAKYAAGEPYFYVPWDLDGVFGTVWTGGQENVTDDIISNGFFDRALMLNPNKYWDLMQDRWNEYRIGVLSNENLIDLISNNYHFLLENKVYEREALVFPSLKPSESAFNYTTNWLLNRLEFLDEYFENINSSTLDPSEISTNVKVFPNPVLDHLLIESNSDQQIQQIKLFDIAGRLILYETGIGASQTMINLSALNSGSYFIQLIIDGIPVKRKIIKN